jgi:hypothetical protein
MYLSERARQAAEEVLDACRHPRGLIDHLTRIARWGRPGVPSDDWTYRNQLIVALRGHSEAKGYLQWQAVGRKVRHGEKAAYILKPVVTRKQADPDAGIIESADDPGDVIGDGRVVSGYMAVPVFGLGQTEPVEGRTYHPLGGDVDRPRVFAGYRQPWSEWYSAQFPDAPERLTALIGAAVVANLQDRTTELQDLLDRLAAYPAKDVADRIEGCCQAVAAYLGSSQE